MCIGTVNRYISISREAPPITGFTMTEDAVDLKIANTIKDTNLHRRQDCPKVLDKWYHLIFYWRKPNSQWYNSRCSCPFHRKICRFKSKIFATDIRTKNDRRPSKWRAAERTWLRANHELPEWFWRGFNDIFYHMLVTFHVFQLPQSCAILTFVLYNKFRPELANKALFFIKIFFIQ